MALDTTGGPATGEPVTVRHDGTALTVVTPDGDDVVSFSPRGGIGGWELVVSGDERHAALFIYSGQSSQGYELLRLRPRVAHLGGMADTYGHGSAPVFSPGGDWLVMLMDGEPRVRETGAYYEEVWDESADAAVVVDWARLYVLRLPELTPDSVPVGVEIPLSTDPDVVGEWEPYDAVRFSGPDAAVLRMPWGEEIAVSLPLAGAVTGRAYTPGAAAG